MKVTPKYHEIRQCTVTISAELSSYYLINSKRRKSQKTVENEVKKNNVKPCNIIWIYHWNFTQYTIDNYSNSRFSSISLQKCNKLTKQNLYWKNINDTSETVNNNYKIMHVKWPPQWHHRPLRKSRFSHKTFLLSEKRPPTTDSRKTTKNK